MAAELLTLKLEELDTNPDINKQQGDINKINVGGEDLDSKKNEKRASIDSRDFFATFYGVFRDPSEALAALLEKKERFGREVTLTCIACVLLTCLYTHIWVHVSACFYLCVWMYGYV